MKLLLAYLCLAAARILPADLYSTSNKKNLFENRRMIYGFIFLFEAAVVEL